MSNGLVAYAIDHFVNCTQRDQEPLARPNWITEAIVDRDIELSRGKNASALARGLASTSYTTTRDTTALGARSVRIALHNTLELAPASQALRLVSVEA